MSSKKRTSIRRKDAPYFFYLAKHCFSNFHAATFSDPDLPGQTFFCSEQHFMYAKAVFFQDVDMVRKILNEKSNPATCKRYGRNIRNFDPEAWLSSEHSADEAMERACYLKFSQNEHLAVMLLATGNRELAEAAKNDQVWGIGFSEAQAATAPRSEWGENRLGHVLMRVRSRIREEMS